MKSFEYTRIHPIDTHNKEPLRILAIGDPHFRMDNMHELDTFIERIANLIKEQNIDITVILGDLLHNHEKLHTLELNKAYDFIERVRDLTPVYCIVGNHDYINDKQFLSQNHWMNAMKRWDNVTVVDCAMSVVTEYGVLLFSPYVPPGRLEEALNTIDDWKDASMVFCHQEFKGCSMNAITSEEGDEWPIENPFVISGHIHDRQRLQDNIYYPGSSLHHAFSENANKTVTIARLGGEKIFIENISLGMAKKKTIHMDVDDMYEYTHNPDSKQEIKIKVSGNYEDYKLFVKSKKYTQLINKNIKVVYDQKKKPTKNLELSTEETPEDFYTILYDKVKDNEPLKKLYRQYVQ